MNKRKTITDDDDDDVDRNDMVMDEEPFGTHMEIETPNRLELQSFIRDPDNYRRIMLIYQSAAPGTVSSRVCHTKTGLKGDDVRLAREDSSPNNVICPEGYHSTSKWPFCCVKDGVDDETPVTKRLKRVEFGRLYRRLRPHASKEITDKKYKAYVKLFL
jgi:hypothetical protein